MRTLSLWNERHRRQYAPVKWWATTRHLGYLEAHISVFGSRASLVYDDVMRGCLGIAALLAACGARIDANQANPDASPDDIDAADDIDARTDAPLGAFGPPAKIGAAADPALQEDDGTLSYSGLELVFAVQNAADNNRKDLYLSSRADLASAFGPAMLLPFSAIGTSEETPRFSADDLTLFFAQTNGTNALDIFRVTRPAAGSLAWGMPQSVAGVNTTAVEKWFMPCDNNRYLVIVGGDLAEGVLGGGLPVVVPELSSTASETGTFLTQDCLTVYFASTRDGTNRIYTATRTAVGQPWTTPTTVDFFAVLGGDQQDPFIATDQRTFVFASNADTTNDIYISTR